MGTRIFVFGTAAGVAIAVIAYVAFRSEPDTAMKREIPTPHAETSPPKPGSVAEHISLPQKPEPSDLPQRTDSPDKARIPTPNQLATRWNAETRDESWATPLEIALGDYLARQPHPNALGSPTVECRATLCRVVTSVDATVFQAAPNADLQAAMGNMQHESLGRELVSVVEGISISPEHPGQLTLSAYLQRIEPAGASNP